MIQSVLDFFRQFRRSERGAVAYLAIVAAIPLTLMLFYVVNSAKGIHDSTRAQDAADMIAMAHAAETARSLNTISMNQVTMTQVWATGVNSAKFHNTLVMHMAIVAGAIVEAGIYGVKTCKKYKSVPLIGAGLMAVCLVPSVQYAAQLAIIEGTTLSIMLEMKAIDAFRISERAIEALNASNQDIYDRFPGAIAVQAEHIAREANVQSLYFDNYCESNTAATCNTNNSNKMKGMELPVTKNEPLAAYTTFCAGLHFGTGGANFGSVPGLGAMGSLSLPLMNGSYVQRGFDMNRGPMYGGGDNDRYLPVHISKNFKIGNLLTEYWTLAERPRLFDGFLNLHMLGLNSAEVAADLTEAALEDLVAPLTGGSGNSQAEQVGGIVSDLSDTITSVTDNLIIGGTSTADYNLGPGLQYPFEQKPDDNVFITQVQLSTANMCAGDLLGSLLPGFVDSIGSFLSSAGIILSMPTANVYHPKDGGGLGSFIPSILPDIDDFDDDYKPLVFTYRQANERWGPSKVFQDPNDGFVAYSQAITFNPDEIGLYSQNWQARLIPATKMEEPDQVRQRMSGKRPSSFEDLEQDLGKIPNDGTWSRVVVK